MGEHIKPAFTSVGRPFQKYSRAARFFQVSIREQDDPNHKSGKRLAIVMWRTLQQWMDGAGLGTAPRKLLEEMAEVRSLDVAVPTEKGTDLRLRTVSKPEQRLAILLQKLGLPVPNKPKSI
jgi:hypothetical protein